MLLNRDAIFDLWAPRAAPWSAWTKPLLFAHLDNVELEPGAAPPPPTWAPPADGTTLIVSDLPGPLSVVVGEALAYAGFRPVPLFNAVPGPLADPSEGYAGQNVVDVASILDALHSAAGRSSEALRALAADAPPAFLLDSNRRHGHVPRPGDFDNRSVSLPTDFPSATFLKSRGIARVVLLVPNPRLSPPPISRTRSFAGKKPESRSSRWSSTTPCTPPPPSPFEFTNPNGSGSCGTALLPCSASVATPSVDSAAPCLIPRADE